MPNRVTDTGACLICGGRVSNGRTKPVQFCSDACKQDAYRIRIFVARIIHTPLRLAYLFRVIAEFWNTSGAGASLAPETSSAQALSAERIGNSDGAQGEGAGHV